MVNNTILVFGDFDPVSNYKLRLVEEALKVTPADLVIFIYESFKQEERKVFSVDEKIALLSSSLPNRLSPSYLIDGDSFSNEKLTIGKKIQIQRKKYGKSNLYILLDSWEYQILEQSPDWPIILSMTNIILYVLKEHKDLMNSYSFASKSLIFINSSDELDALSKASIFEVNKLAFNSTLVDYMNKSGECAIQRVKSHLSPERFRHSLRVAGTIKTICEMVGVEDYELSYDSYIAALYHDICKEMPQDIQETMAQDILRITEYSGWRSLHGPIAAWYLKNRYLLDNEDILESISQHTVPSENPKRITVFLYLADKLEVGKKERYPEDVYNTAWELIESKKPIEAFNFLINYFHDLKMKNLKQNP